MTDKYNSLIVILEKDTREDDAKPIISAIRQIRGVLSVKGNVSDVNSHIAEERVRQELGEKIWKIIYPHKGE